MLESIIRILGQECLDIENIDELYDRYLERQELDKQLEELKAEENDKVATLKNKNFLVRLLHRRKYQGDIDALNKEIDDIKSRISDITLSDDEIKTVDNYLKIISLQEKITSYGVSHCFKEIAELFDNDFKNILNFFKKHGLIMSINKNDLEFLEYLRDISKYQSGPRKSLDEICLVRRDKSVPQNDMRLYRALRSGALCFQGPYIEGIN